MAIEFGVWKINNGLRKISWHSLDKEKQLEDLLVKDIEILGLNLLLIGRSVSTSHGKQVDLLAIDRSGNLVVIELKRDKTPREVVAQALDYGSWVENLSYEKICEIHKTFSGKTLDSALEERFGASIPEVVNENHKLVIVAAELDDATERIVRYLSESFNVPLNTVFFRYFKDGENEYIARTWLVDPDEIDEGIEQAQALKRTKEPWNGKDYYIALGEGPERIWDDCKKFGFISAGQGRRYSKPLEQLSPGDRVFVHVPNNGYVAVGVVKESSVRALDFALQINGKVTPITKAHLESKVQSNCDDDELSEYFVKVDWIKAIDKKDALWEKGFFANQNVVCKFRNKATLERLYKFFGLDD